MAEGVVEKPQSAVPSEEGGYLDEKDWENLILQIKEDRCTPFLGAGACHGYLPSGQTIADSWAQTHKFPLLSQTDLPTVAQFMSVNFQNPLFPKQKLLADFIRPRKKLDFSVLDEPHNFLAQLPISVYLTTNYDSYMVDALIHHKRSPKFEICPWNPAIRNQGKGRSSAFKGADGLAINPDNPVVFHLHGHESQPESLVLTSDDYYDFLINVARKQMLIPEKIQERWTNSTLLFLGYSLQDSTFQVIFRSMLRYLDKSLARNHFSVQLAPVKDQSTAEQKQQVKRFLDKYFGDLKITVYWGTCQQFIQDLRSRWPRK